MCTKICEKCFSFFITMTVSRTGYQKTVYHQDYCCNKHLSCNIFKAEDDQSVSQDQVTTGVIHLSVYRTPRKQQSEESSIPHFYFKYCIWNSQMFKVSQHCFSRKSQCKTNSGFQVVMTFSYLFNYVTRLRLALCQVLCVVQRSC